MNNYYTEETAEKLVKIGFYEIIEGAHFDYHSATIDAINEYLNKEVI